jgi:hypothetical protein
MPFCSVLFALIQNQPRTEHISEMVSRQHGFVKRYGLVRDDRPEAPPVMVPFRRSPARRAARGHLLLTKTLLMFEQELHSASASPPDPLFRPAN